MVMQSIKIDGVLEDILNKAIDMGLTETKSEFIRTAIIRYALDLKILNECPKRESLIEEKVLPKQEVAINRTDILKASDVPEELSIDDFSKLSEKPLRSIVREKCIEFLRANPDRQWSVAEIADAVGVSWRHVVSPLSKLSRDRLIERKYNGITPSYLFRTKPVDEIKKQSE